MKKLAVTGICLLIVTMLAVVVVAADGDRADSKLQALFRPVDTQVRRFLTNDQDRSSADLDAFTEYLLNKYSAELDSITEVLEDVGRNSLSEKKRADLERIIVREHMHTVLQEHAQVQARNQSVSRQTITPIRVGNRQDGNANVALYYVPLSGGNPYPINWWGQVSPDVDGGAGTDDAGRSFDVNGDNELYQLDISYSSTYVQYTLYFRDEDHPNPTLDALYDAWRKLYYGRTYDIESFTVQNGTISFNNIWDQDRTYAYPMGTHGSTTRTWSSGISVYISNVWNHAMDTRDKNPGMNKTWWQTP